MPEPQSAGPVTDEHIHQNNQEALTELCRLLRFSQGEFELILAVCNSTEQRQIIVEQFQRTCSATFDSVTLKPSTTTLFTTIQKQVQASSPQALMVFGLDTVEHLDSLLSATNQVREEFRQFSFPVVLWLTNDGLKRMIRMAPDFYTWANTVSFKTPTPVFLEFIDTLIDDLWRQIQQAKENNFFDNESLGLRPNSPRIHDFRATLRILDDRGITLAPEQKASISFLGGRLSNNNTPIAQQYYQKSVQQWQEIITSKPDNTGDRSREEQLLWTERLGYVQFYLGLWSLNRATRYQREMEIAYEQAQRYFQQAVQTFESINRFERVAHIINYLAEILHRRQDWTELEAIATQSRDLHQRYRHRQRQARAESFLAEVALAQENWTLAQERAETALSLIQPTSEAIEPESTPEEVAYHAWVNSFYRSWFLFSLGKAFFGQNKLAKAINTLEKALSVTHPEYDPELYSQVLEHLRNGYWQQEHYLKAFKTRRRKEAIESQFNFRAFVGARRLQPKQQIQNSALSDQELHQGLIASSGRELDVRCLLARLEQNEFTLTIIYGPSGVGKSSLIEAGLLPVLAQQRIDNRRVVSLRLRRYSDWVNELVNELANQIDINQSLLPNPKKSKSPASIGDARDIVAPFPEELEDLNELERLEDLNELEKLKNGPHTILKELRQQTSSNKSIVLILDQFEEFFFEHRYLPQRSPFYQFLSDCLRLPYVKVVISLREDYTHYLLECNRVADLSIIDNNILDQKWLYFLGNFTPKEAKTVIESLTRPTSFAPEKALIDHIVKELSEESGQVRPIELQLIGSQLQRCNIATLDEYLKEGNQTMTAKQMLIEQYLTNMVEECGPKANQQLANSILYLLTDEQINRPLKTSQRLMEELKDLPNAPNVSEEKLRLSLDILTQSGLVVKVHELSDHHYQLVHDYIATLIRNQQAPRIAELKANLEQAQKQQKQAEAQQLKTEAQRLQAEDERVKAEKQLSQVRKRRIREYCVGAAFILIAIVAFCFGLEASKQKQLAETQKQVAEVATIKALNSVSAAYIEPYSKLDALVASVEAGELVKKTQISPELKESTLSQLQQALSNVRARNRLVGHDDSVLSIAFSPDGERLVASSANGHISLWHSDGNLIQNKLSHVKDIRSVSFSPDGTFFASAGDDGYLKLWSREGDLIKSIKGHKKDAAIVVFHPNNTFFASAGGDGEISRIKLWKIDGSLDEEFEDQTEYISSLTFSPDGNTIASGSGTGIIKIWHIDGTLLTEIPAHDKRIEAIQFSPDSQMIASASADKTVKLWNEDGSLRRTLNDHSEVFSISFSPNGEVIASSNFDGTIRLWNLNGKVLGTLRGHDGGVRDINFSPDGKILASAGLDHTIRFWHQDTWTALESHTDELRSIRFSPQGQRVATSSKDGTIKLWDYDGNLIETSNQFQARIVNISFSKDGQVIAGASADGTIKLWDLAGGTESFDAHSGATWDVKFNSQEDFFASAGQDGKIKFWDRNGALLKTIEGKTIKEYEDDIKDDIYSIDFSPDGQFLASGGDDKYVKLWNMDGKLLKKFETKATVDTVAFSYNGRYLISDGLAKNVDSAKNVNVLKLWRIDGDHEPIDFVGHENPVSSVTFSPNNQLIASGDSGGQIILWNYEGGRLQTFQDLGEVWGLNFSPNNELLASASTHQQGKIWQIDHSKLSTLLPGNLDALLMGSCNWLRDYMNTNRRFKSDRPTPCPTYTLKEQE